jgi:hypothetical protein
MRVDLSPDTIAANGQIGQMRFQQAGVVAQVQQGATDRAL